MGMKVGVIIDAFIAFYSAGIFKFHHKKWLDCLNLVLGF